MQVLVLPSHGDLQHLMEKDQGDRVFHAQASQDRWLDVVEGDVELESSHLSRRLFRLSRHVLGR
jgi:hypothetical protein